MRASPSIFAAMVLTLASTQASAWGERGHNAIARVATRIMAQDKDPEVAALGALMQKKEHMLGHLANVPDIVWRGVPELDAENVPSHFVDLDYILPENKKLTAKDAPADFETYRKALAANCSKKELSCAPGATEVDKIKKAGHAPFRIQQLSQDLTKTLAEVKKLENDPKAKAEERTALIDQALLYAGILAHFVGDLANPHHTSADYDGWHNDQGGLHSYFESEQVDAQSLDLEQAMFAVATKDKPAQRIFGKDPKDPLRMAWELTLASHARLQTLHELDRRHSLLKKSDNARRIKAKRKPSHQVAHAYRKFLVERLSVGADALATVWVTSWNAAGRPKLQGYHSYNYPVKPDFIPLSYVAPVVAQTETAEKPKL
ncbi:S1/P1 nuclease [Oligoflexus tunisiensis]|uniref:S1/P1 nuclease n=1 Tax=Oligoflexus tunisiensis TaxID=708132 RepID=UPI00114CEB4E|nr:S1/P1 nuclease [Oligoflexus tunisiensis]